MEFYLAQTFGFLGWSLLLFSYWRSGTNKLISLQIISCMFFALNYYLLGAFTGLLVVIFEIVRDTFYLKAKNPLKVFYASLPFYILIAYLSWQSFISLFVIFASISDSFSLTHKNKKVVSLGILTYSLWFIYDILCGSYATLIAESFLILSNIIVLCKYKIAYLRSDKIHFSRGIYLDKESSKTVKQIDENNFNFEFINNDELNIHILNNKNVDYISIFDNLELIGYINFIYINKKTFNKFKKADKFIDINIDEIRNKKELFSNYININTIAIKNTYQNEETINKVSNEILAYIKNNHRIKGIISIAVSDFENDIFKNLNFTKLNKEVNRYYIYTCEKKDLRKLKHTK